MLYMLNSGFLNSGFLSPGLLNSGLLNSGLLNSGLLNSGLLSPVLSMIQLHTLRDTGDELGGRGVVPVTQIVHH